MGMTDQGMGAAIFAKVQAIPGINITNSEELQAFCDAVGAGVVEYIQGNAVVNVTSVSGVQSGGSDSGPGTGTIS